MEKRIIKYVVITFLVTAFLFVWLARLTNESFRENLQPFTFSEVIGKMGIVEMKSVVGIDANGNEIIVELNQSNEEKNTEIANKHSPDVPYHYSHLSLLFAPLRETCSPLASWEPPKEKCKYIYWVSESIDGGAKYGAHCHCRPW